MADAFYKKLLYSKNNRETLRKENMMQLFNQTVKILPEGNMLNVSTVLKLGLVHEFRDRNTWYWYCTVVEITVISDWNELQKVYLSNYRLLFF